MMKVFKFGGISLQTKKNFETLYQLIKKEKEKLVIVCSAMGRIGFPYSSDNLLSLVDKSYLSDKDYHHLIGLGEIISSLTFNNYLKSKGLNSYCLSYLEIGITYNDNNYKLDNKNLLNLLEQYDCLVVPGFICKDQNNELYTLGRGNSDLSALFIAKMLSLDKVYLFKDVEGIYPYVTYPIKNIIPFKALSSKETEIILNCNVKVISKDALKFAKKENIEINILSFEKYDNFTKVFIDDHIYHDYFGFYNQNKEFCICCKDVYKCKEDLAKLFEKNHILLKNEKLETNIYRFEIKSSQNLLLKKIIIDNIFQEYNK